MAKQRNRPASARAPSHLEKEEAWLWRMALLFLVLLATGLAALVLGTAAKSPLSPGCGFDRSAGVAVLFAGFAYGRRREATELNSLVKTLQERAMRCHRTSNSIN